MDKETKIEILKIIAMVVILALLICGIVWMNSDYEESNTKNKDQASSETQNSIVEQNVENTDEENTATDGVQESEKDDQTNSKEDQNVENAE